MHRSVARAVQARRAETRHRAQEKLQAVKYCEALMRYQEPQPAAWMPQARDRETWTSNDPRPHWSEYYFYSLSLTKQMPPICLPRQYFTK